MRIAIIPARGGSKRIPRKNIKLFHGKPMIAYSIEAAFASNSFDKVIVSTDDLEIAEIAKSFGADVPFIRPSEIADDYTTTMDVMQHAVAWCIEQSWAPEFVCCIYATAPFIKVRDLQKGWQLVKEEHVKFAFSATTFAFPIQRAIKLSEDGSVAMFSPEYEQTRSQDLVESYHDAGQFYWGEASAFLAGLSIFSEHSRCIVLPRKQVQDIDTQDDWDFAEALYLAMQENL
ncbi:MULTISPECIES: pseudaminic acid cytidylyltransferase [Shewanella]|uniref:pseudaminic acid cytidylyltransferase n=1 Tax=Shewanella TaxID=22 RepID=UPI001BBA42FB|nr:MULTISPECIES: pseudaminic acid cytidylyltransferase [Shewanella]GIU50583.1 pseudaminic acid cytidylyltransferase [Shewanella sp. KT0246]